MHSASGRRLQPRLGQPHPPLLAAARRLSSLKQHFSKKRTQPEAATSSSLTDEDTCDLVSPPAADEDEEYNSRPKRRSISIDVGAPQRGEGRLPDRRTSLEQWHEARRARCGGAARADGGPAVTAAAAAACRGGVAWRASGECVR